MLEYMVPYPWLLAIYVYVYVYPRFTCHSNTIVQIQVLSVERKGVRSTAVNHICKIARTDRRRSGEDGAEAGS